MLRLWHYNQNVCWSLQITNSQRGVSERKNVKHISLFVIELKKKLWTQTDKSLPSYLQVFPSFTWALKGFSGTDNVALCSFYSYLTFCRALRWLFQRYAGPFENKRSLAATAKWVCCTTYPNVSELNSISEAFGPRCALISSIFILWLAMHFGKLMAGIDFSVSPNMFRY